MSKYSVGLRNVGSYMVSGRPYITGSAVNAGEEVKIQFPYVTKNIMIRIPSPPNTALDNSIVSAFERLRTSKDANHDTGQPGEYILGSGNSDFTISFWFSYEGGNAPANQCFDLLSSGSRVGQFRREAAGEFNWNGYGSLIFTSISEGQYHHVVLTQITGNLHYYLDNNHASQNVTFPSFDDITFKPNVSYPGNIKIDEISVWNSGMTHAEYLELHNNGEWFNPNYHSKKSNIVSWHSMGDAQGDHVQASANAEEMIIDLAGGDDSLNLFFYRPPSTYTGLIGTFTEGPFTSQTTGKLRVHGGSKANANVYNNFHYKTLQGYGTTVSLPMKTKEIYLSAIDSQVSFEVIAELTNIPTGSMYDLAGSGIDE